MKYIILKPTVLIGFLLLFGRTPAQQLNSFDGIVLNVFSADSFIYYGEPFWITFDVKNTSNSVKNYCLPNRPINFRCKLKDLKTGKTIDTKPLNSETNIPMEIEKMKRGAVPEGMKKFMPGHNSLDIIFMNYYFGKISLVDNYGPVPSMRFPLVAIPAGEYEITAEYDLLPGNTALKKNFRFKIGDIPAHEKESFNAYVNAVYYAAKSKHGRYETDYAASNPASFDIFLKKYPGSVFVQHAIFIMVTQVYSYSSNSDIKIAKRQEFINYFPKVTRLGLKLRYAYYIPEFIKQNNPNDIEKTKRELDALLLKLKDDPITSKELLRYAENEDIKGLKNYAEGDSNFRHKTKDNK